MAKAQLHEVLAVEQDLRGQAGKILAETQSEFGKEARFRGSITTYEPFDAAESHLATTEREELATTVEERLQYTAKSLSKYWDVVLQKELTNQVASADIVIDGRVIATAVPATMLLGLETRILQFRQAIENMPTLDAKTAWTPAQGQKPGVYATEYDDVKFRTRKVVEPVVLYPAVVKEGVGIPAQVKEVSKDINVGKVIKKQFSGAVTSARCSEILGRVDTLLQAVRSARQRANKAEVVQANIGDELFRFILG